jgi:hypothetical protein
MKTVCFLFILVAIQWVSASTPKAVTFNVKADFERGELHNVAITFDGQLMPAPSSTRLYESDELILWAVVVDSKGQFFMSVGNQGRVFRRTPQGKTELFFDAEEPMIFALAVDKSDNVYAASSPGGKIFKITPTGEAVLFFDPHADYTWDLKFDKSGNLLAATGKPARIYQIDARGQATTIFQGEEQHVRTLTVTGDGLYFGTSGKGLVYQLKTGEKPFVLFDPGMDEVQQILVSGDGFIYAAAQGQSSLSLPQAVAAQQPAAEGKESEEGDEDALAPQIIQLDGRAQVTSVSSSLFRISKQGYGKDLWQGVDDHIQSLAPYTDSLLLVGSGKSGKIYTISPRGEASILCKMQESQVMSFVKNKDEVYFTTANPARLYRMASQSDSSYYESDVVDAGLAANWGKLSCEGKDVASLSFFTRSGNTEQPSQTWSDWAPVKKNDDNFTIVSPAARFVQWKCLFVDKSAVIDKVALSYLQYNQPPEITFIEVHEPGEVFEAEGGAKSDDGIIFPTSLGNRQIKRGFRTIDWSFADPNFDRLLFHLYYRRLNDQSWRVLTKKLSAGVFSWDSFQMADGWYEIRVVATDSLLNPVAKTLTGELTSKPFLVDNTGPAILNVKTEKKSANGVLTFQVKDALSILDQVLVSVDAEPWQEAYPDDAVMDSKTELFTLELSGAGSHDLAIKAEDKNGNITVIHAK